ncbi:putative FAD-dependent dehydrogenase [Aequitasia blattaphilus]|uniref:FAD-dependent oxidoreductase n=1 Tax=Aequitasia blattaphilus TaxID=2949332 RepID=A0ABT1E781_9FIRM|nr:FAD-dependent oxidoreductase [Aequitasia blattaphilus]MCP1101690.1 FAD-dependent oxidoreductase [Aequitasia blattaphilus]MCR8614330.1 FAD-dependent oxidoreductase [Aequitasia blattaphilus]
MIRISQLKLPVTYSDEELKQKILKTLKIKEDFLLSFEIRKRSMDARKKPNIFYVYTIDVLLKNEKKSSYFHGPNVTSVSKEVPFSVEIEGERPLCHPPVVIGSGPAGLFSAHLLASLGYQPILIEQGDDVDKRAAIVDYFWETGELDPFTNVQFGEGGAGTFSDGKLNTLIKDKDKRGRYVLELFVRHGAPKDILYDHKPHIGTDLLREVVKGIREEIISLGGTVLFNQKFEGIIKNSSNCLEEILVKNLKENKTYSIKTSICVLAIGHSARDTFYQLFNEGVCMEPKSFALGVRVLHKQSLINRSQYGIEMADKLPAAPYKVTANLPNRRGVYSFCMCPGGYVVNASSEEGRLAINGMSYHDRGGDYANAAIIVTVSPKDYASEHPLAGIEFQRTLEEKAYRMGTGCVLLQTFGDYQKNKPSQTGPSLCGAVKGQIKWGNVRGIFPLELGDAIEEGILAFDQKIKGYASPDTLLAGIESRTSSPVRIQRDEKGQSNVRGLYPCGEGAGYAGGITSAAMDGLKIAQFIAKDFKICYDT